MEDTLWQGLTDFHAKMPMGITGENLAEKYNITRQECDEFALLSQKRWAEGKGLRQCSVGTSGISIISH